MSKKKKKMKKLMKYNAAKAKKHGYDRHFYLEALGIPIEKCGTNFCDNKDERYQHWMKQREKYGFDSRQTWCLDRCFYEWLYERLMLYKKEASKIVNLEFHKFTINGKEYTQLEAINEMIRLLEEILPYEDIEYEEFWEKGRKIARIWVKVLPAMWW